MFSKLENADSTRLAHLSHLANRWLESWVGRLCLLGAVALLYLCAYQQCGYRPGAYYPIGWWGWADQGHYLKCAASLAQGSLTPDSYVYAFGYPALGALFYNWMPNHAFLIPNLILVVGIAALFFEIARRLITPFETVLLMAAFTFFYSGLLSDMLVVPWNTIPTHFLAYAMILLVALEPVTRKRLLLSALCVGLLYLCRQADAFCMGLLIGIGLLRLPSWSDRIRTGLYCLAIVCFFWGFVLLVNQVVFASWTTRYEKIVNGMGFGGYPVLRKWFWFIVDSSAVFNEPGSTLSSRFPWFPVFHEPGTALFSHLPWLPLVIPGAVCFIRRHSLGALGVFFSIGATYVLYFQFNDFWPHNLFRFLLVHYLFWTFPLLALFAYLGVKEAWKFAAGRWSFGIALMLSLGLWLLTIREEVAGKLPGPPPAVGELTANIAQPVDWILFRGLETPPKLANGHRELVPVSDFVVPLHFEGVLVVLSKGARIESVKFDTTGMPGLTAIEYGRFIWRFQSIGKAVRTAIDRFRGARIVSLVKLPEIDVAGPTGGPDGQPDEVIELELPKSTLHRVTVWDLVSDQGSAHWISAPQSHGWWPIKALPSTRTLPEGQSGVRLCFPNFGNLQAARSARLRGLDDFGRIHLQVIIHPNKPVP